MVPGEHITILNLTVFIGYFLQQKQFISYPSRYMENWSPHGKKKTIAVESNEYDFWCLQWLWSDMSPLNSRNIVDQTLFIGNDQKVQTSYLLLVVLSYWEIVIFSSFWNPSRIGALGPMQETEKRLRHFFFSVIVLMLCGFLRFPGWKWNFIKHHCKLSFLLPLAVVASPLMCCSHVYFSQYTPTGELARRLFKRWIVKPPDKSIKSS